MFNFLTGYTCIAWFGTVYFFHKPLHGLLRVSYPKPGYVIIKKIGLFNLKVLLIQE